MQEDIRSLKNALELAYKALGAPAKREQAENEGRMLEVMKWISSTNGGYKGKKILDVGCSIGVHALAAAHMGAESCGIDKFTFPESEESNPFHISKQDFATIESVWTENNVNVRMHDLAQRFPYENASFDIVVSNAVIEHLQGTHKFFLEECYRVMKPGGTLLLSTPNIAFILKRVRFLIGRSPNWDLKDFYHSEKAFIGHSREFTLDELKTMIEWAGYNVQKASARPTYFRKKWIYKPEKYPSIASYFLGFLRPTFGDHLFVLAKKPNT